jgi:hypothetical protein
MNVNLTAADRDLSKVSPSDQRARHLAFREKIEQAAERLLKPAAPVVEVRPAPIALRPDPLLSLVEASTVAPPKEPERHEFVPRHPTIDAIKKAVCEFYDMSPLHLIAERRTMKIVEARHMAFYLCKTLTPHSYPLIGKFLGGRDHTTVLHGVRKVEKTMLRRDDAGRDKAHDVATLLERITGEQQ